jgi:internalin A
MISAMMGKLYPDPIAIFVRVLRAGFAASILFVFAPAQAQVVTFPDPNLEAAVRDALQIFVPTNIYQTNLSATSFTNFSANGRGIVDLTGLQYATNLTWLQMQGSFGQPGLTNISLLTNFQKLAYLEIPFNRITNASPVAGLTNLSYLDLGWNRDATDNSIRDASFLTNLRRLGWLSVSYLRLTDLTPVAGLTELTNLSFNYNYTLTNASALSGLTNLIELYANSDGLTNITFASQMPRLAKIDFSYCNVSDLSPAVGRNLLALWASYNPLTNANLVTNFTALNILHLEGDNLTNISFFDRLTALHELGLDNNPGIASLSFLSDLTNMTWLSVGQLPLTNVTVLSGLTNLTELHLHDDTNLTSITPLSGLTNLYNLDLNNCPGVNFDKVTNLVKLGYLELDNDGLQAVPFVLALPNLYGLSINSDRFTSLDSLAGAQLGQIEVNGNRLGDISPLVSMSSLNYLDIRNNYLDVSPTSVAWQVITNIQAHSGYYTPVDYLPQSRSSTVTIFDQPGQQCVAVGGSAYFGISASTTAGTLQIQWQLNSVDLPGQTNASLLLTGVSSNQAGFYRAVLLDDNGGLLSAAAPLYVGDPNCGQTILIQQQPLNTCAAPGDAVAFTVTATTTLTNLYYQWQFDGTNLDGQTSSELDLFAVDTNAAGFYRVLLTDDSTNVVASALVELKVVDVVSIVDPILSNLVFQSLGLPAGSPIHLTDLDNLSYISAGSQGITNLAGLECARNLYSLDLNNNPIGDPSPLSWLTSLSYLNVSGCGLQDASFVSSLVNLYDLEMGNNQIHSIPIMDNLVNLQYLNINNNGCLIDFPRLAVLTNLISLSLHSDCLPDISFVTYMTQLQSLDVGGDWMYDQYKNTITDVSPLSGKANMNWLSLSWNQATNVPTVAAFTNMQWLYLSGNPFQSLSFISNMPGMVDLSIDYSQVTNVAPLAAHSPLTSLNIGYIATTNLTVLAGLTNLQGLSAGGNYAGSASMLSNLINLGSLSFEWNAVPDATPLARMTNLWWLQFENNRVPGVSVLADKTNLHYLYLTGNQIHDLTPLSGLTNLLSLSLSGNGFTNVAPLAPLTNLTWLVMQSNYIQNVSPLVSLSNRLNTLDVSANLITDISPLTNLHALTSLSPWQNQLTSLPSLVGLSNITSLDFWGNQLTNVVGVSGMTQLNWLGLSQNHLSVIQPLTGLPNLATLSLWGNQLTNVAGVSGLPSLGYLDLSQNYLTVVQPLSGLPALNSIDLHSNYVTDVSGLSGLTSLRWLYLSANDLQTIHPLTALTGLYYADLTYNLLNTNANSPAMLDIGVMQGNGAYVNYIPQKTVSGASVLLLSPASLGGNQFRFTLQSLPGAVLQVQSSTNLVSWTNLALVTNVTGTVLYTDSVATARQMVYRAHTQ